MLNATNSTVFMSLVKNNVNGVGVYWLFVKFLNFFLLYKQISYCLLLCYCCWRGNFILFFCQTHHTVFVLQWVKNVLQMIFSFYNWTVSFETIAVNHNIVAINYCVCVRHFFFLLFVRKKKARDSISFLQLLADIVARLLEKSLQFFFFFWCVMD